MNSSNLLIISHNKEEFMLLENVLKCYFPSNNDIDKESSCNMLMIKNKYYQAEVKMNNIFWEQTQLFTQNALNDHKEYQALQLQSISINQTKPLQQELKKQIQLSQNTISNNNNNQLEQANKYDLMIMLVNEQNQEQISFGQLDALIDTINPEEFVLFVNTERPDDVWKYEEVILEKCNNFIQIVKDDLQQVAKNKPKWGGGALLNDDNEETMDSGVFSVLDRMETTRWRNMVDMKSLKQQHNLSKEIMVKQQEKADKKNIQTEQSNENNTLKNQQQKTLLKPEKLLKENPSHEHNSSDEQQQKHKQQKDQEQQLDEDQLQAEMKQFEQMMGQMISFKAQSSNMKDSQRKIKAEELFIKMFEKVNY